MKKLLLFTSALLLALSPKIWAETPELESMWTLVERRTMACAKSDHESIIPDQMDSTQWEGTISDVSGEFGAGCSFVGTSPDESKMGIFSIYKDVETVPSYTQMELKWTFQVGSKSSRHHSTTCLYSANSYFSLTQNGMDFSNHYDTQDGSSWLIGRFTNKAENGEMLHTDDQSYTLTFNNLTGSEEQALSYFMMMSYVLASAEGRSGLDEWGYFKTIRIDTSYSYSKHVSFDANGGEGSMDDMEVLNICNLFANTFTRAGYTFAGWALSPEGEVAYSDNGTVIASATNKGPMTLYAVWREKSYEWKEGPWTQKKQKSHVCANDNSMTSIRFDDMNNTQWSGTITGWKDDEGIGFSFRGESPDKSQMGIFSTYENAVKMPSYSRMKLTWTFQLGSYNSRHHSATCLYGVNGSYEQIINLAVDFSNHHDTETGAEYLVVPPFVNKNQESTAGTYYTDVYTREFVFDNIEGSMDQTKTWYLLLTHVLASAGAKQGVVQWGAFRSLSCETEWTYRKIISFNGNGGIGSMLPVTIDNTGKLPSNTFTREGYTFAGWAKAHDGKVVYTDQAAITATAADKGSVTLYAQWNKEDSPNAIAAGPWELLDTCSAALANQDTIQMSFDSLQKMSSHWGAYRLWNGDNGIGFTIETAAPANETSGFLSLYQHSEADVPAYTNRRLTWRYQLGCESSRLPNLTSLYIIPDSLVGIKSLPVMFSPIDNTQEAGHGLVSQTYNASMDGTAHYTDTLIQTIDFDNRESEEAQTKHMYLMMKHVAGTSSAMPDVKEWGAFLPIDEVWEDLYYKHITFHSNDGTGSRTIQAIENSGTLSPNTYTYDGYSFRGWSTTPAGEVEYADEAPIVATADNKGALDLYAHWEIIHYNITYDLDGGTASNPETYTILDETITLQQPTKKGLLFFGWTGSNGEILQKEVTIESGSTGDKHFVARWGTDVVPATMEKINQIGTVEYTEECYSRIFVARYYYESLSTADRELVTNYSTLEAAEARYEELRTNPDEDDCSEALWPNP